MAFVRPTSQPSRVVAGDTWAWDLSDSTYQASEGWTLALRIAGRDVVPWQPSYVVVAGNTYQLTLPPAATESIRFGNYAVSATFTLAGARYTRSFASITVLANPAAAAAGDRQSWAETLLFVVNERISGRVSDDVQYYNIEGRAVNLIPIGELLALQSRLRSEVNRLRRLGKAAVERWYFSNG